MAAGRGMSGWRHAGLWMSLLAISSLAAPVTLPYYNSMNSIFPGDFLFDAGTPSRTASPSFHSTYSLQLKGAVDRVYLPIAAQSIPNNDLRISFYLSANGLVPTTSCDVTLEYTSAGTGAVSQLTVSLASTYASIDAHDAVTQTTYASVGSRDLTSSIGKMQLIQLDYSFRTTSHSFSLSINSAELLAGTTLEAPACNTADCVLSGVFFGSPVNIGPDGGGAYYLDALYVSPALIASATAFAMFYMGPNFQSPYGAKTYGMDSTDFETANTLLLRRGRSLYYEFTGTQPRTVKIGFRMGAEHYAEDAIRVRVDFTDGAAIEFEISAARRTIVLDPRSVHGTPVVRALPFPVVAYPRQSELAIPLYWNQRQYSVILDGIVLVDHETPVGMSVEDGLVGLDLYGAGDFGVQLSELGVGAACLSEPTGRPGVRFLGNSCAGTLGEFSCSFFDCDDGYYGSEGMSCDADADVWYGGCDAASCPMSPWDNYGSWNYASTSLGSVARLTCPDGMEVYPPGSETTTCTGIGPNTAAYRPTPGVCRWQRCAAPEIPNSAHKCGNTNIGNLCSYSCAPGFEFGPADFDTSSGAVELSCGFAAEWAATAPAAPAGQWPPVACVPKIRKVLISMDSFDAGINFGGEDDPTDYPTPATTTVPPTPLPTRPPTPLPTPAATPAPPPGAMMMEAGGPNKYDEDAVVRLFRHRSALALDGDLVVAGLSVAKTVSALQTTLEALHARMDDIELSQFG